MKSAETKVNGALKQAGWRWRDPLAPPCPPVLPRDLYVVGLGQIKWRHGRAACLRQQVAASFPAIARVHPGPGPRHCACRVVIKLLTLSGFR